MPRIHETTHANQQARDIILDLCEAKSTGRDRWMARCPAHEDRSPSLSIRETDDRILLHCFAGCGSQQVVDALGLSLADLFTDAPLRRGPRPTPKPLRANLRDLSFRFELCALDLRRRAARVFEIAKGLETSDWSDEDIERAIGAVDSAYADLERAELFEAVADRMREKDCDAKRGAP